MSAWSQSRVQTLEQVFAHIAATRMQGVPVQNPALRVQAVGFAPQADPDGGEWLLGVLVTPWFMNLVWWVLGKKPAARSAAKSLNSLARTKTGSAPLPAVRCSRPCLNLQTTRPLWQPRARC